MDRQSMGGRMDAWIGEWMILWMDICKKKYLKCRRRMRLENTLKQNNINTNPEKINSCMLFNFKQRQQNGLNTHNRVQISTLSVITVQTVKL